MRHRISGCRRDGVPPPKKTEVAAGEVAGGGGTLQLEDARVGVALHEVVAVGVGGEGAVVAPLPAERDVDIDAERVSAQRPAVERTERMRRSRCASMAEVASSATSSAPGGGGPDRTPRQVAAEDPAQQRQRGGAHGAAAAVRPAQGAARRRGRRPPAPPSPSGSPQAAHSSRTGPAPSRTRVLRKNDGREQRRVRAVVGQRAQCPHEHRVEAGVGMALLGHLVGHLQEGHAARHPGRGPRG